MQVRTKGRAKGRTNERGLTLIEVLVAFFLLFVVTLAILELLSMAYLVNRGALIRTDLTYRAERVVETLRVARSLGETFSGCADTNNGPHTIPTDTSAACYNTFWGPNYANVVEPDARYALSYDVSNNVLTVEVRPRTDAGPKYLGPSAFKVVRYVTIF